MTSKKSRLMRVDLEFHRRVKELAARQGITAAEFTKKLTERKKEWKTDLRL